MKRIELYHFQSMDYQGLLMFEFLINLPMTDKVQDYLNTNINLLKLIEIKKYKLILHILIHKQK